MRQSSESHHESKSEETASCGAWAPAARRQSLDRWCKTTTRPGTPLPTLHLSPSPLCQSLVLTCYLVFSTYCSPTHYLSPPFFSLSLSLFGSGWVSDPMQTKRAGGKTQHQTTGVAAVSRNRDKTKHKLTSRFHLSPLETLTLCLSLAHCPSLSRSLFPFPLSLHPSVPCTLMSSLPLSLSLLLILL
jgi:hypothetical protein